MFYTIPIYLSLPTMFYKKNSWYLTIQAFSRTISPKVNETRETTLTQFVS